jgi:hypothetical protein
MRIAYSIKQKAKIATLLFFIMACSILITILEEKSVKNMNESFISMYNDRLIPALDLFHVLQNVYTKKSFVERLLYTDNEVNAVQAKLQVQRYNFRIDSLIRKYEQTTLVGQEKQQLAILKQRLLTYLKIERDILTLLFNQDRSQALELYENSGKNVSEKIIDNVSVLMSTQKQVGTELLKDSAFAVSGTRLYSTLQIALAIIIGILIVGILFTSNVVNIKNDKYTLN